MTTSQQVPELIDQLMPGMDAAESQQSAQTKALIEALVAEVKITGSHQVIPIFRVP